MDDDPITARADAPEPAWKATLITGVPRKSSKDIAHEIRLREMVAREMRAPEDQDEIDRLRAEFFRSLDEP